MKSTHLTIGSGASIKLIYGSKLLNKRKWCFYKIDLQFKSTHLTRRIGASLKLIYGSKLQCLKSESCTEVTLTMDSSTKI